MNLTENALKILKKRYLKRDEQGKVIEEPIDMFKRIAHAVAEADRFYSSEEDIAATINKTFVKFLGMMVHLEFLPNSPTLMNAGRELQQLAACFTLPVGDSMEEIFTTIKNMALIQQSGGGTGFSFSCIRPKNDVVKSTNGVSCLTGDTFVIRCNFRDLPIKKQIISIQTLYDRFERGKVMPSIRCVKDDNLLDINKIEKIVCNGYSKVFRITTKLGYTIKATNNHRFLTKQGYTQVDQLKSGELLAVNGVPVTLPGTRYIGNCLKCQRERVLFGVGSKYEGMCESCCVGIKQDRQLSQQKHIGNCSRCKRNLPLRGTKSKYAGLCENCVVSVFHKCSLQGSDEFKKVVKKRSKQHTQYMNTPSVKEHFRQINSGETNPQWKGNNANKTTARQRINSLYPTLRTDSICERCGSNHITEIHHKDGSPFNNERSNLEVLCSRCHHAEHTSRKRAGNWRLTEEIVFDEIKEIVPLENEELVYDIAMKAPYHNFIANGFVSHNSGPISFMTVFNAATETVRQGGKRRGANMGILRIDHPDILDFISCKRNNSRLNNFNISVAITDVFMDALKNNTTYDLINPRTKQVTNTLSAESVFNTIVESAWANGEPGIIFIDEINRHNPTPHIGEITATNPCITNETLVAVADGRIHVSMKQLVDEGKDVPVFTRNNRGKVTVRMMRNPRLTGRQQKILKVIFDDGNSLRVTEYHKFRMSDGTIKKAKELTSNDSLDIMTRRIAAFEEIFSESNSKSQNYAWINSTTSQSWQAEHRLIAGFYIPNLTTSKTIVHHRDGNGLNNVPSNLIRMSKKEHDTHHALDKMGDKNPMRRFPEKNWMKNNPEKLREVRIKNHVGAKRSEVTKRRIGEAIVKHFTNHNFRKKHSNAVKEAMKRPEVRTAFEDSIQDRAMKKLQDCQSKTDLPCFLDVNTVMITKTCEICGIAFDLKWSEREIAFCSRKCGNAYINSDPNIQKKRVSALQTTYSKKMHDTKSSQISCLLDLKFKLGRMPQKTEWESECSYRQISKRLGTKFGFSTYKHLQEIAETTNHRVVSVTEDGIEDVYNGTVDEFHNFYAGGFENSDKKRIFYINNLQCGEMPLLPLESCNLGSINLSKMTYDIENTTKAIDWTKLRKTVHTAVHFLDNIIDINKYPLPEIEQMTKANRKIGLGVMGWADLLIEMRIPYNSNEALELAEKVMQFINEEGMEASKELAAARGCYPNAIRKVKDCWGNEILDYGLLRNATITTIAPTGTLSLIAGCSSGIEPLYALAFKRKQAEQEMVEINKHFNDYLDKYVPITRLPDIRHEVEKTGTCQQISGIPEDAKNIFVTAHDISYDCHVKMQAAFQKYTSNAVSKTINLPHDATQEDVKKAYLLAHKLSCKGITVYRDGSRSNQTLSTEKTTPRDTEISAVTTKPRIRPIITKGVTHKINTGCGSLYITVNSDDQGVCEVFSVKGKSGGCAAAQSEAVSRLISLALRSGVNIDEIIKQIKSIRCPSPTWNEGNQILSCPDAIAKILEQHNPEYNTETTKISSPPKISPPPGGEYRINKLRVTIKPDGSICPDCPECGAQLQFKEGCVSCECGYSKCG